MILDSTQEVKSLRSRNLELVVAATTSFGADASAVLDGSDSDSGGDDSDGDESESAASASGTVGCGGGLRIKPSQKEKREGSGESSEDRAEDDAALSTGRSAREESGARSRVKKRRRGP